MKALSTELFIEKVKKIHNNKYDYSLVEYKNTRTTIKIICPNCGIFEILPHSHIQGTGCSKCYNLTTEKFIERSYKIHNNKYIYDKVNIINNKTKVTITCSEHGDFKQRPDAHMNGQGCLQCFKERKKSTTSEFITKSNNKHNNLYDYSLVKYKSNKHKIKIVCNKHGIFEQTPHHHLSGSGCPICNTSKGEIQISNILENFNIKYEKQKTFEECKHKAKLRFDFYLPVYNMCIEFNGIQHYEPNDYFGGINEYNINKKRFSIKKKFCKENDIKLLIIKYDENINEKLSQNFFNSTM